MSVAAALLLLVSDGTQQTDWRAVATLADRARLRGWRDDWRDALAAVRGGGNAAAVAADPVLFDPDAAFDAPTPPVGGYRCRVFRFSGSRLLAGNWGRCLVPPAAALRRLEQAEGDQRFDGTIYPDGTHRSIYLGTAAYPGERHPLSYAHASGRDMIGIVERVAERRWRVVLPRPHYGSSALDVVELVPES